MHLFEISDFGTRYSIDVAVTDFYNAISEASRAATQTLAQRLRFEDFGWYIDRVDYFEPARMFGQGQDVFHRQYALSRGFVTTVSKAWAVDSLLTFRNNDTTAKIDLTDVSEDGQSNRLFTDLDRGLCTVEGVDLSEKWVVFQYTGGLDLDTDEVFQDVPEWLRALAMTQAALFLSNNPQFQTEDAENDITIMKNDQAQGFAEYARFFPSARKPTMTER